MTDEQREAEVEKILVDINKIRPEWVYLGVKIQTKTFTDANDQLAVEKEWNRLDSELFQLNKKLRALQTEYYVDFVNDQNLVVTAVLILNIKVDIDTRANGWTPYMNNAKARQLIFEIHGQLSKQVRRPGICHIKST